MSSLRAAVPWSLCWLALVAGCSVDSSGTLDALPDASGSGGTGTAGSGGTGGGAGTGGVVDGGPEAGGGAGAAVDAQPDVPIDVAPDTALDAPIDVAPDTVLDAPDDSFDAPVEAPPDVALVEVCSNGVDDDGDGQADCADSDCVPEVVCVPSPPAGWGTPSYVYVRPSTDPAGDCGTLDSGDTLQGGLTPGAHECTCTCGQASSGICGVPSVTLHADAACSSIAIGSTTGQSCQPLTASIGTIGSIATHEVSVSSQGICSSFVDPKIDGATWSQSVDVCSSASAFAGCTSGHACVPRSPASFESSACIARAGDVPCPVGPYASRRVFYQGASDTRDCSVAGCACGVASGAHCSGTVNVHSTSDCSLTIRSFQLDGTCKLANLGPAEGVAIKMTVQGPSGGQCPVIGSGTKTGSVSPTGAMTVCCMP